MSHGSQRARRCSALKPRTRNSPRHDVSLESAGGGEAQGARCTRAYASACRDGGCAQSRLPLRPMILALRILYFEDLSVGMTGGNHALPSTAVYDIRKPLGFLPLFLLTPSPTSTIIQCQNPGQWPREDPCEGTGDGWTAYLQA